MLCCCMDVLFYNWFLVTLVTHHAMHWHVKGLCQLEKMLSNSNSMSQGFVVSMGAIFSKSIET